MLCDTCRAILEQPHEPDGVHHEDFESLERAANAENPCYICDKVLRYYLEYCEFNPESAWGPSLRDDVSRPYFTRYKLPISQEKRIAAGTLTFYVPTIRRSDSVAMRGIIFRLEDVDLELNPSRLPLGRPSLHGYPGVTFSRHMEAQVKRWLNDCLNCHVSCRETSTPTPGQAKFIPSRLLDLGQRSDSKIRLWIREGSSRGEFFDSYMTLSHRWDNQESKEPKIQERQLKLTWRNIEKLRLGIRKDDLPNTWQDAIFVAKSIGARFLWIDSLCVIQEKSSHEDFFEEAGQMANIYGNSLCNITAIGATTSEDGCMYARHPNTVRPCRIAVQQNGEEKEYFIIPTNLWGDEVDKRPLQSRGWVFQEIMLAPRILHLARRQIYWQCHELKACEVFPGGIPHYVTSKELSSLPRLFRDIESHSNIAAAKSAWEKILETYSDLQLTDPSDKLNALLGVIRRLEVVFSDQCVAGLWSRYLPLQLLWRSVTGADSDIMEKQSRPAYRAPTWSWASIDQQVMSGHFDLDDAVIYAEVIAIYLNGHNIPLAANRHVNIPREIEAGLLRISSHFMTAELCVTVFGNSDTDTELIINEEHISVTSEDISIDAAEDFNGSHVLNHEPLRKQHSSRYRLKLFCLIICERRSLGKSSKNVECLLLRKAERTSSRLFTRYGYVKLSGYQVRGKSMKSWDEVKNAEWFPHFESRDQFGKYQVDII